MIISSTLSYIWLLYRLLMVTRLFMFITGQALAESILDEANSLGLDMSKCRGQAYDGASNMSGAVNGCAAIIRKAHPLAKYSHCKSHCLNLAIMKVATSIPEISMYTLTDFNANVLVVLEGHCYQWVLSMTNINLSPICQKIWAERFKCTVVLTWIFLAWFRNANGRDVQEPIFHTAFHANYFDWWNSCGNVELSHG